MWSFYEFISTRRRMTMAIGLLAILTVQEGKSAEFEQVFLDLTEQVRANEPGTSFYALHRSKDDPHVYKVMEQYDSAEALEAHGQTEYYREASKALGALLATPPEIEILDSVKR